MVDESDQLLGYKHPPKARQFQPGVSGNPSGRPKRAPTLAQDFQEELSEIITLKEGKQVLEMTRQRALVHMLVKRALAGDLRAMRLAAEFSVKCLGAGSPTIEVYFDHIDSQA